MDIFSDTKFFPNTKDFRTQNFSWPKTFPGPTFFQIQKFSWSKIFTDQQFSRTKLFPDPKCRPKTAKNCPKWPIMVKNKWLDKSKNCKNFGQHLNWQYWKHGSPSSMMFLFHKLKKECWACLVDPFLKAHIRIINLKFNHNAMFNQELWNAMHFNEI